MMPLDRDTAIAGVVPTVSVVMSVYNGASTLAATIESVLAQTGVTFELIIVDDGSTDGSSAIISEFAARDFRIRVLTQANQGLTCALVAGCSLARGRYIARQDCGDLSMPSRLRRQAACLDTQEGVVLTSCATRFMGPQSEFLYTVVQTSSQLMLSLRGQSPETLRGPSSHGSTMFRRDAYEKVGGYRPEFRVAQDLDLWTRLVEIGACVAIEDPLFEARLEPGGISASKREEQVEATRIIAECVKHRRNGGTDKAILEKWLQSRSRLDGTRSRPKSSTDASFYYFIGSLLQDKQPAAARSYFRRALEASPFHFRSLAKLLLSAARMK